MGKKGDAPASDAKKGDAPAAAPDASAMGKKGEAHAEAAEEEPEQVLEGDFAWPDGSEYSGEYVMKKDKIILHGKGRMQTGPEVFQGTFENGLYREGTFHGADGSVYKGAFRNNAFHGPGEYTWADGRVYRGMWQDGCMHGRGEFENFSFGADRVFHGFCAKGRFLSSESGQEAAKREFLADYAKPYIASAMKVAQEIFARAPAQQVVPDDPKAKNRGQFAAQVDAPADLPKEYLVVLPAEGTDEAVADGEAEAAASLAEGPFPENGCVRTSALWQFGGRFAEGAENPGRIVVLESRSASLFGFAGQRLQKEQLGHLGQAVAFVADDAEVGAIRLMVLLNVCLTGYSAEQASWKLLHCETTPEPQTT